MQVALLFYQTYQTYHSPQRAPQSHIYQPHIFNRCYIYNHRSTYIYNITLHLLYYPHPYHTYHYACGYTQQYITSRLACHISCHLACATNEANSSSYTQIDVTFLRQHFSFIHRTERHSTNIHIYIYIQIQYRTLYYSSYTIVHQLSLHQLLIAFRVLRCTHCPYNTQMILRISIVYHVLTI